MKKLPPVNMQTVEYRDASFGRYGKGPSAMVQAPVVGGLEASQERPQSLLLVDAFDMVLQGASRGAESTWDWNYYVKRFMCWLQQEHPRCTHWHLLTRRILRQYLGTYKDKSPTMRRLAMQPISQTSGFMHREYGVADFASRLGVGAKKRQLRFLG